MSDQASISSWRMPDAYKHSSTPAMSNSSGDSNLAWADVPFALIQTPLTKLGGNVHHPAAHMANESAHLFNAMLRGLNAIYQQAPYVQTSADVADFNFLVHSWAAWVIHHMDLRGSSLFPSLEAALLKPVPGYRHEQVLQQQSTTDASAGAQLHLVSDLLHEHSAFVPCLHRVLELAEKAHLQPETYSSSELVSLLVELGPHMQAHLARQVNEVFLETIRGFCGTPGSVSAHVTGERLMQCWQACDSQSSQSMDRFVIPPMMVRCRDVTYEDAGHDWPGLPVPQVHAIADRLSRTHKGAWRFLPCDVWGRPVELCALVAAQQQGLELDRHHHHHAAAAAATLTAVDRKGKGKAPVIAVQELVVVEEKA
ncbi:uncharacterized protein B0I36DRAFT_330599 [Microdochium trichocladiopsis]|uniref:Hemerythrin-like domain-containing protein n=1 Tax=Microdochium trichocladiopsis TaxID=1682393 RepID=A0A9P9BMZ4_9PEZI|nr:uncharacterized protein B0I36DRAFT_330599 [Microdochium trichocladiopsis]KAH7026411.1 hypothetical protein B0I36DRAFT_330599 [Microdochium trichocladiopsis]